MSKPDVMDILNTCIQRIAGSIADYCKRPGVDFTRTRKLPIETLLRLILAMEGNSLNSELFNNFPEWNDRMTASAFVQQRDKLDYEAFRAMLHELNQSCDAPETMDGLRVYAVDGSDFNVPGDKNSKWYIKHHYIRKDGQEAKGTCLVHGNFLYDLLNKLYIDMVETRDERDGAIRLLESIPDPRNALVIFDRGYSGFNMIENCNRYGGYYVIRFPLSNTIREINELLDEPCDRDIEVKVSTKSQQWCDLYGYRHIQIRKNTDEREYSDNTGNTRWDFEDKCTVKFRVVKFQINSLESGKPVWEVLVTNLPREKYGLRYMKRIYHKRWGIETSLRDLKYALGAVNFHSRKDDCILQDLYAHLVMYNATSLAAAKIPVSRSEAGHFYVVDFKMVVHIFRVYFRIGNKAPPPDHMYEEMSAYRHMLRRGRRNVRVLTPKSVVNFLYRVA